METVSILTKATCKSPTYPTPNDEVHSACSIRGYTKILWAHRRDTSAMSSAKAMNVGMRRIFAHSTACSLLYSYGSGEALKFPLT